METPRPVNPAWERISVILREQHLSAAALAKLLGLPDPRALYRIKNRGGRITPRLAATIHRILPDYDAEWLRSGAVTFVVEIPAGPDSAPLKIIERRISQSIGCLASVSRTTT